MRPGLTANETRNKSGRKKRVQAIFLEGRNKILPSSNISLIGSANLNYYYRTVTLAMRNVMLIQDAKTIGKIVKTTRKKLGVTQRDLALTAGTGLRFIIELERGKPTCQLEKTLLILRTLGIKLKIENN